MSTAKKLLPDWADESVNTAVIILADASRRLAEIIKRRGLNGKDLEDVIEAKEMIDMARAPFVYLRENQEQLKNDGRTH